MKTLILSAVLFTATSPQKVQQTNNYCNGFEDGYEAGACYQIPNCIPPLPPLCPLPTINEENTYQGGFERGFAEGLNDQ